MEFEITTNKGDEYDNEYDLPRSELVRLKDEIINQTDYFKLTTSRNERGSLLRSWQKSD
jgi:hypothetical protein